MLLNHFHVKSPLFSIFHIHKTELSPVLKIQTRLAQLSFKKIKRVGLFSNLSKWPAVECLPGYVMAYKLQTRLLNDTETLDEGYISKSVQNTHMRIQKQYYNVNKRVFS